MKCDGCGNEFKTLYGVEGYWLCSTCREKERITENIRLRNRKAELVAQIKEKLEESKIPTLDAIFYILNAKRITLWLDAGELIISGDLSHWRKDNERRPKEEQ